MLLLALDTCDARGSLAILKDDDVLYAAAHDVPLDYSSWLLPAADAALAAAGLKMPEIEVFAVAAGPGSFTGIRVGLTTVKAWAEVYGARIAAVSRLEVIAQHAAGRPEFVAAFVDAQRAQVFGAVFRRCGEDLALAGEELVIAPDGFLAYVEEQTGAAAVSWVSMDPEKITALPSWHRRAQKGETVQLCEEVLAPAVGRLGRRRILLGDVKDPLTLDAEYVRRSDAEIFWKGGAKRGA